MHSLAFTCDSVKCHEAIGDGRSELIFLSTESRPYGALLNDMARARAPTLTGGALQEDPVSAAVIFC